MTNPVLITHDQIRAKGIPLSKVQLWRLERDGRFPRRVRVTPGRVAWVENEIDDWLSERIAARPAATKP